MKRPGRLFAASIAALAMIAAGCSDDDGAEVRESGSVSIVGDPPPGGGGSVSATGSGCTTKGATTRLPASTLEISLDEHTITAPATAMAGVVELVVKNLGDQPHELVIAKAGGPAELPRADGRVDEAALEATGFSRIASFPRNTICRGTFDLAPGTYVLFDNLPGPSGQPQGNFERGMVATITVT